MAPIKVGICEECGRDYSEIKTVCGHCGYFASGGLNVSEDPYWKCGGCGRTIQALKPPEKCTGCGEVCDFKNVTCYTPECGGSGNIDPRL